MPPDPHDLLAHAGWLRRLAVSLVGAGGAEDLVQETWLAAFRRPPREDGPLRPWLAQVLKNLVRMRARHGGVVAASRPEVERAERARAAPTPEALLGRLETERLLARLVAELDEPFRQTVLLRYLEGLSAAEIARAQGIPAATVRWRLMTGLDRLRAALDASCGGDRRAWRLALVPLAASARRALVTKGLLIMTRAQKIGTAGAALLALLALLGGLWLRREQAAPVAAPVPAAAPAPALAPASPPAAAASARPPAGQPDLRSLVAASGAKVAPEPALANGAFGGRVLNWSTGRTVAGAQVVFTDDAGGTHPVQSDAEGRFELIPPKPGRYVLAVATAQGFLPFAPEWDHSPIALTARPGLRISDVTIFLRPALDYTGVVLSPDGKPVAGATITLLGASSGELASSPIADHFTSDASGEFIFHAPDQAVLEARHPSYGPGRGRLDGAVAVSHHMEIRLTKRGTVVGNASIKGKVVDGAGNGIAGALVHAEHKIDDDEHPDGDARSGADGRFVLEGLDAGEHSVSARSPGHPLALAQAKTGSEVTLTMAGGSSLAGRVVDDSGAPAPAFSVIVSRPKGITENPISEATVIDGEGRFQIDGLEPGDVRVRATAAGYAPSPPVEAHVGEPGDDPVEVVLKLPRGGTLRGQVVERDTHRPLPLARLTVEGGVGEGPTAVPLVATTVSDENGEFVLGGVAPGIRSLLAAAADHHMRIISGLEVVDGATLSGLSFELTALKEGEKPTLELAGIGAQLRGEDDALMVDRVIPGGGAAEAGMQPGDGIVRLEGVPVTEIGFQDAIQRVRGPEGSRVRLAIRRAGAIVELVVVRKRIVY